ncbi:hypothetical protein MJ038_15210 [Acinetobacter baumannii]|nr:hypothetical protein [Acinetobacter baumannii]MDA3537102.1 hypothetical protein [Acinetobacter baumannii]
MKKNWDWYESQFGYRYSPDSLRGKGWAIWQEAWQHQQAKVEELQTQLSLQRQRVKAFEEELTSSRNYGDELQKRVASLEKTEFKLAQVKAILQNNPKLLESILVKKIEQALKGDGQ